LEVILSTLL